MMIANADRTAESTFRNFPINRLNALDNEDRNNDLREKLILFGTLETTLPVIWLMLTNYVT